MRENKIDQLIHLQELLVKLGEVERADFWPGSPRQQNETVLEHSFSLAVLSWQVAQRLNLKLDHEKILKYALVHDLPEAYTGDLPLFSGDKEQGLQGDKERKAIDKLQSALPESGISEIIRQYNQQKDEESRFIHAMDALVAVLVHISSRETQFVKNKITKKHIEDILPSWRERTDISKEMIEFTDELLEIWRKTVVLHADNAD